MSKVMYHGELIEIDDDLDEKEVELSKDEPIVDLEDTIIIPLEDIKEEENA